MIKRFRAMTWRQRAAAILVAIAAIATGLGISDASTALTLWRTNTATEAAQSGFALGLIAAMFLYPLIARWATALYRILAGQRTQTVK